MHNILSLIVIPTPLIMFRARRKKGSKKKGPVRSKKVVVDGIQFASGLEAYMWKALKNAGITAEYESEKFTLMEGFKHDHETWERQRNGKGDYKTHEGQSIRKMVYTPDFIIRKPDGAIHCIIETKGRANDAFPLRWKLFKQTVKEYPDLVIFKPQKQSECDTTVLRILELQKK